MLPSFPPSHSLLLADVSYALEFLYFVWPQREHLIMGGVDCLSFSYYSVTLLVGL